MEEEEENQGGSWERKAHCGIIQHPCNKISYSTTCEGIYLHYS